MRVSKEERSEARDVTVQSAKLFSVNSSLLTSVSERTYGKRTELLSHRKLVVRDVTSQSSVYLSSTSLIAMSYQAQHF